MAAPRGRGINTGLTLLATQMMHFGVKKIPPVTLALIAGQTAVYLELFDNIFPSPMSVCMSSYLVYHHRDWMRMIKGTFYHGDDMHLYFNMASLMYKGSLIETAYGSSYFAYMIAVFTGLTSATYVGLGLLLGHYLQDPSYITSCAVGFSGVLFALKVIVTEASPPGVQYLLGSIPIPSKYFYWVELIAIQLVAPNASFVGHLAGILVGLAYCKGPLKFIMDIFHPPGLRTVNRPRDHSSRLGQRSGWRGWFRSSRFTGSGHSGHRDREAHIAPPLFSGDYRNDPRFEEIENMWLRSEGRQGSSADIGGGAGQGSARPSGRPGSSAPYGRQDSSASYARPGFSASYSSSGASGGSQGYPTFPRPKASAPPPDYNTNGEYTDGLDEDDQYNLAIMESIESSRQTTQGQHSPRLYPDLSELRAKRAHFYK
ncbi:unnamed protein product [Lymnaea stagnalis]|uniref:Peptidase S54 rhomboid domain-containing protein n=1 Tax=Lymnaea stagnalis TaxID=6523 RepID=A0AAV2H0Y4_LYMST